MGRQDAAQPARQRDHHDLGDQIGGLYPGDLILTGGEPAADFLQRRRHDLDVQVGNEKPKAHHAKSEDLAMSRQLCRLQHRRCEQIIDRRTCARRRRNRAHRRAS